MRSHAGNCAKCRAEIGAKDRFCQQCGALADRSCPNCGDELDPSTFTCNDCGHALAFAARCECRLLVVVGKSARLDARCFDDRGAAFPRAVRWSTPTPALIRIEPSGMILGLSPGVGRIVATADAASASVELVVAAPPLDAGRVGTALDRATQAIRQWRRGDGLDER